LAASEQQEEIYRKSAHAVAALPRGQRFGVRSDQVAAPLEPRITLGQRDEPSARMIGRSSHLDREGQVRMVVSTPLVSVGVELKHSQQNML